MKRPEDRDEVIQLTEREIRIMVALAKCKMSGYEIAKQCVEDSSGEEQMSNGTLYPALKRLDKFGVIENVGTDSYGPGKPATVWDITRTGRMMLEWELASYRKLVRLGQERL